MTVVVWGRVGERYSGGPSWRPVPSGSRTCRTTTARSLERSPYTRRGHGDRRAPGRAQRAQYQSEADGMCEDIERTRCHMPGVCPA